VVAPAALALALAVACGPGDDRAAAPPATPPPHHGSPGSADTTAPPGPLPCPEDGPTTTRVTGTLVDTAGRPLTGIATYGKPFTRFLMAAPWALYFGHEHTSVASWATDADVGYATVGGATDPVRCGRSYRLVLRRAARVMVHVAEGSGARAYLSAPGWPWPVEG
jgi:hypothetical protein